jgi:hypothetical protein
MWNVVTAGVAGLPVQEEGLLFAHESANQVQIAAAGCQPEGAKAFLAGYRDRIGANRIIACLYFHQGRCMEIYAPPSGPTVKGSMVDAENEGLQFLESMGFVMSDTRFNAKPEASKLAMREDLPFLWDKIERFAQARDEMLARMRGGPAGIEPSSVSRSIEAVIEAFPPAEGQGRTAGGCSDDSDMPGIARFLARF